MRVCTTCLREDSRGCTCVLVNVESKVVVVVGVVIAEYGSRSSPVPPVQRGQGRPSDREGMFI